MKVLICINDLISDEPGLMLGQMIARFFDAEITLLHVLPKKKKSGDRDRGEQLLEKANNLIADFPVSRKVRRDDIVNRIVKEAEKGDYDLVIITVSRLGEQAQIRSIHRALLNKLPCCLLVAKNPRAEINRMLICTGGLQMTEILVEVGAKFAKSLISEVTLFHVAANIPSMYTGLETIEETLVELLETDTPVARHLRRGAEILAENNIDAELKLRHGSAVYEIVREIDRKNHDMVVIGASGADTVIKEWFYGNITQNIVDAVGIPVLVVNQEGAAQRSKFKN